MKGGEKNGRVIDAIPLFRFADRIGIPQGIH
jgi:hypothetical protein